MADNNTINKEVEEKTSFGTYIAKDLKMNAMLVGGAAIGAGVGYAATKSNGIVKAVQAIGKWIGKFMKPETAEAIAHLTNEKHAELILPAVGATAGVFAAAVPNTYEHWREGKKLQLRAEEMTDDIIALRQQRNAAMTILREQAVAINNQNKAIQDILARGPKNAALMAETVPAKNQVERIEHQDQQPSEPRRG